MQSTLCSCNEDHFVISSDPRYLKTNAVKRRHYSIEGLGMDDTKGSKEAQVDERRSNSEDQLKSACPYCLLVVDVYRDIKDRPYWRCWRCEVRSFGTKTALKSLSANGWIWTHARPLKELHAWLKRISNAVGLKEKGKE
jgi:hypothetical protein